MFQRVIIHRGYGAIGVTAALEEVPALAAGKSIPLFDFVHEHFSEFSKLRPLDCLHKAVGSGDLSLTKHILTLFSDLEDLDSLNAVTSSALRSHRWEVYDFLVQQKGARISSLLSAVLVSPQTPFVTPLHRKIDRRMKIARLKERQFDFTLHNIEAVFGLDFEAVEAFAFLGLRFTPSAIQPALVRFDYDQIFRLMHLGLDLSPRFVALGHAFAVIERRHRLPFWDSRFLNEVLVQSILIRDHGFIHRFTGLMAQAKIPVEPAIYLFMDSISAEFDYASNSGELDFVSYPIP